MRSVRPVTWRKVREGAAIALYAWGFVALGCAGVVAFTAPDVGSVLLASVGVAGGAALTLARWLLA